MISSKPITDRKHQNIKKKVLRLWIKSVQHGQIVKNTVKRISTHGVNSDRVIKNG